MKASSILAMTLPLLAACDYDYDGRDHDTADDGLATVSVAIKVSGPVEHVQQLTLRFTPSHMYRVLTADEKDFFWKVPEYNVRVFTDGDGRNRVVKSANERPSTCPNVSEPPSIANRVPEECSWLPHSDLTLINALAPEPLLTQYIARDYQLTDISFGTYYKIIAQVDGFIEDHRRDSFVILDDGRECDLRIRYPDLATTGAFYMSFPLEPNPAFNGARDVWRIVLTIDVSGVSLDPAQCAAGYDLMLVPGGAVVERI